MGGGGGQGWHPCDTVSRTCFTVCLVQSPNVSVEHTSSKPGCPTHLLCHLSTLHSPDTSCFSSCPLRPAVIRTTFPGFKIVFLSRDMIQHFWKPACTSPSHSAYILTTGHAHTDLLRISLSSLPCCQWLWAKTAEFRMGGHVKDRAAKISANLWQKLGPAWATKFLEDKKPNLELDFLALS